jgi:hypothetical protein
MPFPAEASGGDHAIVPGYSGGSASVLHRLPAPSDAGSIRVLAVARKDRPGTHMVPL